MNVASFSCWKINNINSFLFSFPIKIFHLLQQSHKSINIPACSSFWLRYKAEDGREKLSQVWPKGGGGGLLRSESD